MNQPARPGLSTVLCRVLPGGDLPSRAIDYPDAFNIQTQSVFSTRDYDQSGQRKLLFDFDNQPGDTLDSYHAHKVTRNGVSQYGWSIYPDEAFLVGTGVNIGPGVRQLFTPAVGLACCVRSTYYEHDSNVHSQAVVLLANDSDNVFTVYRHQLLGYLNLIPGLNNVILDDRVESTVDFNQ